MNPVKAICECRTLQQTEYGEAYRLTAEIFGEFAYLHALYSIGSVQICGVFHESILAGVLHLLPCFWRGGTHRGFYVYAAGIREQYRKNGLFRALFSYAGSIAQELGADFLFLVPENQSLFSLYKKLGMQEPVYRRLYRGSPSSAEPSLPLSYDQYLCFCKDDIIFEKQIFSPYIKSQKTAKINGETAVLSENGSQIREIFGLRTPFTLIPCGLLRRFSPQEKTESGGAPEEICRKNPDSASVSLSNPPPICCLYPD